LSSLYLRYNQLTVDRGSQELVTIYIKVKKEDGSEQKKFIIHKNFACHYSPMLKAAFTGSFLEGQTQSMVLEDVEEEIFALFVNWLYSQKVEDAGEEIPDQDDLIRLWVLGQRLLVPKLQDQTIDALHKRSDEDWTAPTHMTKYIYDNTVEGSALRRWIVDQCTLVDPDCFVPEQIEGFPREMLFELAAKFATIYRFATAPELDAKNYHVDTNAEQKR
jgi:hypothetical protein